MNKLNHNSHTPGQEHQQTSVLSFPRRADGVEDCPRLAQNRKGQIDLHRSLVKGKTGGQEAQTFDKVLGVGRESRVGKSKVPRQIALERWVWGPH